MTEMTRKKRYIVFTDIRENEGDFAEHWFEHDDPELEYIIAMSADQDSTDPNYQNDWPGWDGETQSYYIQDYDHFRRIAHMGDVDIQIMEV